MMLIEYLKENFVLIFELIGLVIVLEISAHISERMKRLTLMVALLLFLESLVFHVELWTQSFERLSLLRPMLTACSYSLYPVIMVIVMQITSLQRISTKKLILLLIPLIISIPVFFTSQWTHLVFWDSETNSYQGGLLPYWPYTLFGFYTLIFLIQNLFYFRHYSRMNRLFTAYIIIGPVVGVLYYIIFQVSDNYCGLFTSGLVLYFICIYIHRSKIDPLTTLLNRQSYYQDLKEMAKSITGVVSVDMNELKYLNDTFGHEAGDTALKSIAAILQDDCGSGGTPYRIGGDEFMILYTDTDEAGITDAISAMREKLTKTGYVCAFGYTMREPDEPIQAALTKADGKMYENKAAIKAAMQERGETLHYRDNRIR